MELEHREKGEKVRGNEMGEGAKGQALGACRWSGVSIVDLKSIHNPKT